MDKDHEDISEVEQEFARSKFEWIVVASHEFLLVIKSLGGVALVQILEVESHIMDRLRAIGPTDTSRLSDLLVESREIDDRVDDSGTRESTDSQMRVFIPEPGTHRSRVGPTDSDPGVISRNFVGPRSLDPVLEVGKVLKCLENSEIFHVFEFERLISKRLGLSVISVLKSEYETVELLGKVDGPGIFARSRAAPLTADVQEYWSFQWVEEILDNPVPLSKSSLVVKGISVTHQLSLIPILFLSIIKGFPFQFTFLFILGFLKVSQVSIFFPLNPLTQ